MAQITPDSTMNQYDAQDPQIPILRSGFNES
jgi:hypothetical protein